MKYNVICLLFFIQLFSCNADEKVNKTVSIKFSKDSSKIVLRNFGEEQLYQLGQNLNIDSAYQRIVSVIEIPAESEGVSKELIVKGNLTLQGDSLIFNPDEPFQKGKTYLVETIVNSAFASREQTVKGDIGHHLKATQQELIR